jgi:hypothetical protein
MRLTTGSPRLLVGLLGLILILLVIGSGHSSALNGALLLIGAALIIGAAIPWLYLRVRRSSDAR